MAFRITSYDDIKHLPPRIVVQILKEQPDLDRRKEPRRITVDVDAFLNEYPNASLEDILNYAKNKTGIDI